LAQATVPQAPVGYRVREVLRFDEFAAQVAADGPVLYVLMQSGNVLRVAPKTGIRAPPASCASVRSFPSAIVERS
jgi:hypothetical protein